MGQGLSCGSSDELGLFSAVQLGDLETVKEVMGNNSALVHSSMVYDSNSALHVAAANDQIEVLSFLLDGSVKPDVLNRLKQTPLMLAAMRGNISCVKKLIEAGANILMFDSRSGRTCLHYAAYYGHSGCLQAILSAASASPVAASWGYSRFVSIRDRKGATPLHLAARQRHPECVNILLDNGALVSASTGGYSNPLHFAARGGSLDCIRELLAWGADRIQQDASGLIAQWCEANGTEPPKRPSSYRATKTTSACSPDELIKIEALLHKLTSASLEDQRSAAGEIRLLAKWSADNRVAIAEAGAIPLLVQLLSTPDSRTQEHSVTALLNLSICDTNKGSIISSGAVPGIVLVLKKGSMEARENAAATLFSLSVVDENKVTIGSSGAIPPLVTLLSEGTQRGKQDAATALFNLCIYQGNKGKAVRAGLIPTLMRLLTEPQASMVDEALAILAIFSSHPEGKAAIGAAVAVPVLVDIIGNGSPRNKENAAAVLVHLCSGDQQHLADAQELGVMGPLLDLAQNGTERGKRKAALLLERMDRFVETQKQARAQAETRTQNSNSESAITTTAIAIAIG